MSLSVLTTLRIKRVSRLFRDSLSFSKKLDNHIDAIKYFICDYKLEIASLFSQFAALDFAHYQFS